MATCVRSFDLAAELESAWPPLPGRAADSRAGDRRCSAEQFAPALQPPPGFAPRASNSGWALTVEKPWSRSEGTDVDTSCATSDAETSDEGVFSDTTPSALSDHEDESDGLCGSAFSADATVFKPESFAQSTGTTRLDARAVAFVPGGYESWGTPVGGACLSPWHLTAVMPPPPGLRTGLSTGAKLFVPRSEH